MFLVAARQRLANKARLWYTLGNLIDERFVRDGARHARLVACDAADAADAGRQWTLFCFSFPSVLPFFCEREYSHFRHPKPTKLGHSLCRLAVLRSNKPSLNFPSKFLYIYIVSIYHKHNFPTSYVTPN